MVRAFIALELSEEIRAGLARAQDLLRPCAARMTFVDPPLMHITVKFLGEVDERTIPRITDSLSQIPFSPFEIRAGEISVNNPRRPQTIWSTISDGGNGERLLAAIDTALQPWGFLPESRRFTAHATIARIKSMDPSLIPALKKLEGITYGTCRISGMKLKKSTLTPRGPVYEDIHEVRW